MTGLPADPTPTEVVRFNLPPGCRTYADIIVSALHRANLLASGGSGEAPAGLTREEARAVLHKLGGLTDYSRNAFKDARLKLCEAAYDDAALRGPSAGEVVATESGEGG